MRIRFLILTLLLGTAPMVSATYFPIGPNHTLDQPSFNLLANKFLVLKNIGPYVLGVTEDGFLLYTIDANDSVMVPVHKTYTDFTAVSVRLDGTQLIFRSDKDILFFYDISSLPQVTFQGKLDLGLRFADYLIDGRYIYVSRWYDGISRYRINSFSKLVFADSSMKGVLVTELARKGRYLYALDEYNGIMRYEMGENLFGEFIDYLYVSERPTSFLLSDSGALIQTKLPSVYRGELYNEDSLLVTELYDSIGVSSTNRLLLREDNYLVLAGERNITVVNLNTPMTIEREFLLDDHLPTGDLVHIGSETFLLLPGKTNGASFVPIERDADPFPALSRPGIITGLTLQNNALVTAGAANPIDVYGVDTATEPEFLYTIPDTRPNVRAFDQSGDTLAVLYSPDSRIDLIINPTEPDSLSVVSLSYPRTFSAQSIQLHSRLRDSITAVVVQHVNELQMIPWPTGDTSAPVAKTWETPTQIQSFFIHDSVLLVATTKRTVLCYIIKDDFTIQFRGLMNMLNIVTDFFLLDPQHVLLFNERVISRCDISVPYSPRIDTAVVLPIAITAVDEDGGVLFGIGPNGVGVFSLKSAMPVLIDRGGKWGTRISAMNTSVAASDGAQIHLYRLRDYSNDSLPAPPVEPELPAFYSLSQNYPNPFNGITRIWYEVPKTGHVKIDIFNILGQQVRTLVDLPLEAGQYEAVWDGKAASGKETASGIYYYRLTADDVRLTKKMILVK